MITRKQYRTTNAIGEPTSTPQPKVVFAAGGAAVGVALSEIGVWVVEASVGIDIPAGIEASIGVVVVAGLSFLAGYVKRPSGIS